MKKKKKLSFRVSRADCPLAQLVFLRPVKKKKVILYINFVVVAPLCFCIFHDLIKDIIRTLTSRECLKATRQRDKPQGFPHSPLALLPSPSDPLVEGNKTETWPNSANGRRRRSRCRCRCAGMETAPTTEILLKICAYICLVSYTCTSLGVMLCVWGVEGRGGKLEMTA